MRTYSSLPSLPCLGSWKNSTHIASPMWVAVSFAPGGSEWARFRDTGWLKALGVPPVPAH